MTKFIKSLRSFIKSLFSFKADVDEGLLDFSGQGRDKYGK